MPAHSLSSMVQNAIGRNIDQLQSLGDLPYDAARPILKKIRNPEKLRELELSSPHLADKDAELWKAFIERDVPDYKSTMSQTSLPKKMSYKLYAALKKQEDRMRKSQEEELRQALSSIDKRKEANKTQVIHQVIPEARKPNNSQNRAPTLKNAKPGDYIKALRQQSRDATHIRKLNTIASVKPQMSAAADRRRTIKEVTRQERSQEPKAGDRKPRPHAATTASDRPLEKGPSATEWNPWKPESSKLTPGTTAKSQNGTLDLDTPQSRSPAATPSPPSENRPAASPSPEKKIHRPASMRRPASIFAPKPPKRKV